MYDRTEFLDAIRNARSSSRLLCAGFQRDLSALLDGEIREEHAQRAMGHLESCSDCAEFFQAIRLQVLAHRDLAVPGSLASRLKKLRGEDFFDGLSDSEIVRRVAGALYQLGKAYVVLGTSEDYLLRLAEEPVAIEDFERGEVAEATEAARQSGACLVPEGLLRQQPESHLDKGRRLLDEVLRLKPRFAEARLYSGFVYQVQNAPEAAAREYREVFLRTDRLVNRAHAAIQLGMLYDHTGQNIRALRMYRWVVASGLVSRKREFAFVLYNIAVEHLAMDDLPAARAMLHRIRLGYPGLWESAKGWLRKSPELLGRLQADADFSREILAVEPAFFAA